MWGILGALGLGAWYLYKNSAQARGTAPAGSALEPVDVTAQYELPGSAAPAAGELSSGAGLWNSLTPVDPIAAGFINFPSGTQAAASEFASGLTRMDQSGAYYVSWAGRVYRLGDMDAQGNWPAILAG